MNFIKEVYPYVLIVLSVILIRTFFVTPVRVNGESMEPNLYDREILILEKINRSFNRFDVIVLNYDKERLVKRIVGLPGEHIKYVDGKLYVNNKVIVEDFTNISTKDFDLRTLDKEIIPEDFYFVMGDNRNNSTDSRFIGLISKKDIIGTVRLIIYPFNHMGLID